MIMFLVARVTAVLEYLESSLSSTREKLDQ